MHTRRRKQGLPALFKNMFHSGSVLPLTLNTHDAPIGFSHGARPACLALMEFACLMCEMGFVKHDHTLGLCVATALPCF